MSSTALCRLLNILRAQRDESNWQWEDRPNGPAGAPLISLTYRPNTPAASQPFWTRDVVSLDLERDPRQWILPGTKPNRSTSGTNDSFQAA